MLEEGWAGLLLINDFHSLMIMLHLPGDACFDLESFFRFICFNDKTKLLHFVLEMQSEREKKENSDTLSEIAIDIRN